MKPIILIFIVLTIPSVCGKTLLWKDKQAAVVLTYDDALNVHLDNAIPLLDSLGLKATFYLSAFSPGCSQRVAHWKKAAATGHELANHTLFHPCIGDRPGREFVPGDHKLNNYTVKRMVDEVRMTNVFLEALDGKKKRTFAFTCGDMKIGDTAFFDGLKEDFMAARTVYPSMPGVAEADVYNLPCYPVNGQSGNELIALVKQAVEKKALLIFLFHGVGGEHGLNVSLDAHRQLLQYLQQHEKTLWVTTALDASAYIKQSQSKN
ncbi:MAG TPA: polysaccharide deacetylase family protein [Flavisolibacter sp.]|nr:polysaccharide deacetylase family protein [Flavisolibacter sp.]